MNMTEKRIRLVFEETRRFDPRMILRQTGYLTNGSFSLLATPDDREKWLGYSKSEKEKEFSRRDLSVYAMKQIMAISDMAVEPTSVEDTKVKLDIYLLAPARKALKVSFRDGLDRPHVAYFDALLMRYAMRKYPKAQQLVEPANKDGYVKFFLVVKGEAVFVIVSTKPDISTLHNDELETSKV